MMRTWHRIWLDSFKQNRRYVVVLAALISLTVLVLAFAYFERESFGRNLLVNLGATLGGVVLTVLILQPIIEKAQAPEVIVHYTFPHHKFQAAIGGAQNGIRLMGAWPYGMDLPFRAEFLGSLRERLLRNITVQVLVLNPLSDSARQRTVDMRAADLKEPTASARIADVLIAFVGFSEELPADAHRLLEIRVFDALPPARLYLADDHAFCSFFGEADNRDGSNVRHYETSLLSGLGYYVNEAFDRLWSSRDLLTIEEYWRLRLRVSSPQEEGLMADEYTVAYVVSSGGLFVIGQGLFHDIGHDRLRVHVNRKITGFRWDGVSILEVMTFDRIRDHRAAEVVAAANIKYGDEGNVYRSFLEIQVH